MKAYMSSGSAWMAFLHLVLGWYVRSSYLVGFGFSFFFDFSAYSVAFVFFGVACVLLIKINIAFWNC